jgi:SAM-dependent methyltransferase
VPAPEPDQYDSFAGEFESHAEVSPYNTLVDRPVTLRLVGDVAGRRVLDAACGPGLYLEELLARGADAVGCDAAPAMVELARARVGDRAEVHVQSLDEPITWVPDGSVDVVLCALAYHYLNDRPAFLAECRRVLRPDGAVVISTHHPADDWRRLGGSWFEEGPVTETWSTGWTITAWRVPLTRLSEEFADAGFVIERLVEPRPDPAMAESHPAVFESVSTMPPFMMFKLRLRTA